MYKIRKAEPNDFHVLLPLAEKFYNSTEFAVPVPFDIPSILEFYIGLLQGGVVFMAELDGKAVGMLGAHIQPFHLNQNHLVCSEAMWWVEPEARGLSVAGDLVRAMEAAADEAGCTIKILSMLKTSPAFVEQYYESLGYRKAEMAFIKEV